MKEYFCVFYLVDDGKSRSQPFTAFNFRFDPEGSSVLVRGKMWNAGKYESIDVNAFEHKKGTIAEQATAIAYAILYKKFRGLPKEEYRLDIREVGMKSYLCRVEFDDSIAAEDALPPSWFYLRCDPENPANGAYFKESEAEDWSSICYFAAYNGTVGINSVEHLADRFYYSHFCRGRNYIGEMQRLAYYVQVQEVAEA